MGRHKEEGSAVTHVRVSKQTRQLLQELKAKHGFATIDQVLKYYLPSSVADNRPVFHSAKEIYELTKSNPDINRLIKDTSNQIMHKINKDGPNHSSTKTYITNRKSNWHRRRRL